MILDYDKLQVHKGHDLMVEDYYHSGPIVEGNGVYCLDCKQYLLTCPRPKVKLRVSKNNGQT